LYAGSPLALDVVNPANKMSLHYGNATTCVPVTQTVWATVNLAGYACLIPPEAIIPTVIGVYAAFCRFIVLLSEGPQVRGFVRPKVHCENWH